MSTPTEMEVRKGLEPSEVLKPRGGWGYRLGARLADLLLGGLAIVVLLLPGLILAVLARRSTGGSSFFKQVRVGMGGKLFTVVKFRTLRVDAPDQARKSRGERSATPFGRVLRDFKIDELPQLLNVIKGEMSLVGPRPEMPFLVSNYSPLESLRLSIKPGLTGLWQLSRAREKLIHANLEYDLFYLANRSIGFDFWLIYRTMLLLLFGRGTKVRAAAIRWERDTSWRRLLDDRGRAVPRRAGWLLSRAWMLAAGVLLAIVIGGASIQMLRARGDLERGADSLQDARKEVAELRFDSALTAVQASRGSFADAEGKLGSWATLGARFLPIIGSNVKTARSIAAAGNTVSEVGADAIDLVRQLPLRDGSLVLWQDGSLDLAPLRAAKVPAVKVKAGVNRAREILEKSPSAWLLPPIADARNSAIEEIQEATRQADIAVAITVLAPAMLGEDSPRRWIIAAENTAELRGRGGYFGSLGVLTAAGGRLEMGDFIATTELPELVTKSTAPLPSEYLLHYWRLGALTEWQNLTMSPHFPSGASLLLNRLEESGGPVAEGIISMDPVGLSYLLEVTGEVSVEGVSTPISAENVVSWSLNQAYFDFEGANEQRREALAGVAEQIWKNIASGEGLDPRRLADSLGRALEERRLVLYSAVPEEQALLERLGMAGGISSSQGDYLMVLGQNTGENKMDYYLKRHISYSGSLQEDGSILAELTVTVQNTAKLGVELPAYIAGERHRNELAPGTARTYLSTYIHPGAVLTGVVINGKETTEIDNRKELGKRLLVVSLELPPGDEQSVQYRYRTDGVVSRGSYNLVIQQQSTVIPDELSISISSPSSGSVGSREGFERGEQLTYEGLVDRELELSADIKVPIIRRLAAAVSSILRRPVPAIGE